MKYKTVTGHESILVLLFTAYFPSESI